MKQRKLTRQDFAGLRQHYPVLSEEEMRQYIAGHSELYNEQSFFPTNPYIIGMEMEPCSLEQTIKEKTENVDDTNCNIFSSNWNEEAILFSSGYNNYNSNEDWLYHGFGGYDPDGNFHWYSGYTQDEFYDWEGDWPGGWVYGMGYVGPDIPINGYYGDDYTHINDKYYKYDFVEGMGGGASYQGDIYVRVQNDILDVVCNVKGIPGYSSTYKYVGAVEVYVDGNKVQEIALSKGDGPYITEQGSIYVGSAMVNLTSYHGKVEVKVLTSGSRGDSYTGYSAINSSTTVYSQYR